MHRTPQPRAARKRQQRRGLSIRAATIIAVTFACLAIVTPHARSSSWPMTPAARHFRFPPGWLLHSGVFCIHRHEAVDWHETSNPVSRGGMQVIFSTWASVGGTGDPAFWSIREQVYRAYLIWRRDGGSFREWTTATVCHLR